MVASPASSCSRVRGALVPIVEMLIPDISLSDEEDGSR
jgi:hypothetical protein